MFKSMTPEDFLKNKNYEIDEVFFRTMLKDKIIEKYEVKRIKVSDLKRKWFDNKIYDLTEVAPYKYLQGDKDAYTDYCQCHADKIGKKVTLCFDRFDKLIKDMDENGYDPKHIIICDYDNTIIDGQHRSCYLLYKYGPDYEIDVLRLKLRLPYIVMLRNLVNKLFGFLRRP